MISRLANSRQRTFMRLNTVITYIHTYRHIERRVNPSESSCPWNIFLYKYTKKKKKRFLSFTSARQGNQTDQSSGGKKTEDLKYPFR